MKKYKRIGKELYHNVGGAWSRLHSYDTEKDAKEEFRKREEQDRKFRALQKDLFLPREIQGLFGHKGGLWSVNIETDKMKDFRKQIYQSRRKDFSSFMRVQLQQGKPKDKAFNDAYVEFMEFADQKDIILTMQKFHELYPDERRQKSSW